MSGRPDPVEAFDGWPADRSDNDTLIRLVALNQERVREEAAGQVRWLRPDYQIPASAARKKSTENTKDHEVHGDTVVLQHRGLTERVIGLAIEVHRTIGPGLLESVYTACLCLELEHAGIPFDSQVVVPVTYKDKTIPLGFRADLVVNACIIIEFKAVATLLPAHQAQLLTYLRMSGIRIGLLMNFYASRLKDGLLRFIV
jgi:GxxExxY protein